MKDYDYSWGCPLFKAKLLNMEAMGGDFNTVFIGSSHTWRHFNPILFDSILIQNGISSRSYNLGIHGMGNPENYYICEQFIKKNSEGIENLFLTLDPIKTTVDFLFHPRYTYCLTGKLLPYFYQTVFYEDYPLKTKIIRWMVPTLNYGYKLFTAQKWRYTFIEKVKDSQIDLVPKFQRGYYSLDQAAKDDEEVLKRKSTLKDTTFLVKKREIAKVAFSNVISNKSKLNKGHLKKINYLIDLAQNEGIKLRFIIHPLNNDYSEWKAIQTTLPEGRIIELANPNKYPELYNYSNLFDYDHYNSQGSNYLTEYLAGFIIDYSKEL